MIYLIDKVHHLIMVVIGKEEQQEYQLFLPKFSTDNPDIVVALQATQIANRNERINEEVGGLDLLGTYTYDLEIIGSIPEEGGPKENYPTNFTFFQIEDT